MKVVLDHNVPLKLRRTLPGHYIRTAAEMGWATLMNGVLLKAGEAAGFDLMVTCDQNIFYQQNLKGRSISLVVLTTNNWKAIKERTGDVLAAINASRVGSFALVKI